MKLDEMDWFMMAIACATLGIVLASCGCTHSAVVVDEPVGIVNVHPNQQGPLLIHPQVAMLSLGDVFFDRKEDMPAHLGPLEDNMKTIAALPIHMLLVFGHTDITGRSDSNLGLGLRRANTVAEYYATLGVPPEKIITVTCGEDAPQCSEDAELCHQANRRVRTLLITEVVTTP